MEKMESNCFVWIVVASVAVINICIAAPTMFPCIFPTCDIPPPHCRVITDEYGCPTCNSVCEYGPFICPTPYCGFTYCPLGWIYDQYGCQTCMCVEPYKPPPMQCHFTMNCPQGHCQKACRCKPHCAAPNSGQEHEGGANGSEEPYEA